MLVLAGSREQLEKFDEQYRIYRLSEAPTLIIGGGRVGRAAARTLDRAGARLPHRRAESGARLASSETFVLGNAAELERSQASRVSTTPPRRSSPPTTTTSTST